MFDHALILVADDTETGLVSRNKVPGNVVDRLSGPDAKIWKSEGKINWTYLANLAWHRVNIFGQMVNEGSAPWK
ncbi:hypothetical protein RAZWK3B_18488 [Roseobacter sp. AzwK-3b]|nr:hypothetical protein RAZWK3B_18488 [Roseobacter sp. AzwK-3b]